MTDLRIVFMGTPEFAVTILDKLVSSNENIVGVITAPDKPAGRGRKIHQSAVKEYAVEKGLHLLQPTNLKDEAFIDDLKALEADLFVVVAFRMLPEVVWAMPPKGTINLHGSLLPNYRGAAPINWAIINGEKETGVSTFFIEKEIDTGKVIEQAKVEIGINETVGELYYRLMHLGAETMLSTVEKIAKGDLEAIDQSQFESKQLPAPKIFKDDCKINFNQSAQTLHNFIRGLDPYPAAWCELFNSEGQAKTYKVYSSEVTELKVEQATGFSSDKEGLLIPTNDYYVRIKEIQPEGKRKMDFKSFLAGNSLEDLLIKG